MNLFGNCGHLSDFEKQHLSIFYSAAQEKFKHQPHQHSHHPSNSPPDGPRHSDLSPQHSLSSTSSPMQPSRSLPNQSYVPNNNNNNSHGNSTHKNPNHYSQPHSAQYLTPSYIPQPHQSQRPHHDPVTRTEQQEVGDMENKGEMSDNENVVHITHKDYKISCKMLRGVYGIIPVHDPTYLTREVGGNHHSPHQRFQNQHANQQLHTTRYTHALDLSLLMNLLTTKTFPLDFPDDDEGPLDLDYNTERKQTISQSNLCQRGGSNGQHHNFQPHPHFSDHFDDYDDNNHPLPLTAITRISPSEPLSLITPMALLSHFIERNPSLSLPLPPEDNLYCAIEIYEGSEALDLTGFISALTQPLVDRLGLNSLAYVSTYLTDILLVPLEYARIAFTLLIEAAQTLSVQNMPTSLKSPSGDQTASPQQSNQMNSHNQLPNSQHRPQQPKPQQNSRRQVVVINPELNVALSCFPLSWFHLLYSPLLSVLLNSTIYGQAKPLELIDQLLFHKLADVSAQNQQYQQTILDHTNQKTNPTNDNTVTTPPPPQSLDLCLLQSLLQIQSTPSLPSYTSSSLFSFVINAHSVTLFADKAITTLFLLSALPLIHNQCIIAQYPQLTLPLALTPTSSPHQPEQDPVRTENQDTKNQNQQQNHLPSPAPVVSTVMLHPQTWDIYHIFVGSYSGSISSLVPPVSNLLATNQVSLVYLSTHSTDLLLCQTPSQKKAVEALSQRFDVDIDDEH